MAPYFPPIDHNGGRMMKILIAAAIVMAGSPPALAANPTFEALGELGQAYTKSRDMGNPLSVSIAMAAEAAKRAEADARYVVFLAVTNIIMNIYEAPDFKDKTPDQIAAHYKF